ncbi:MAG: hypothetical protein PHX18_01025 [Candidatus Gastranaerophilales bacterium]|nr:hypothetical protein [Candidatus Gastranaerophilales bacterium]
MSEVGAVDFSKIGSAAIRAEAKKGDFKRVSQQYPEVYEALLEKGIAKPEGTDYNNYKLHTSLFSQSKPTDDAAPKTAPPKPSSEKLEKLLDKPIENTFSVEV